MSPSPVVIRNENSLTYKCYLLMAIPMSSGLLEGKFLYLDIVCEFQVMLPRSISYVIRGSENESAVASYLTCRNKKVRQAVSWHQSKV